MVRPTKTQEQRVTLRLEPLERAKTYQLVVRRIQDEIFAGRLKPGDRLPGERQLSEQLQVSRPSVREAVRILEAMEIVRSRPGTGATSGLIVSAQPSRALSDLLRLHVALSSYSVSDVIQVRLALEDQSVRRLAEHIQDADASRVRDTLEKMGDPDLDRSTFHHLDTEFHIALARCSDNSLLADLMAALRDAVRRPMAEAFDDDEQWDQRVKELVKEHEDIFEAVLSGDGDRAAVLMRQHIGGFYDSLDV
jgi:GntR family transcriptional regulator, transcriptional repressor for pyruvate dehydrogenase complex